MDAELIIMDSLKAKEAELERNLSETIEQNGKRQLRYHITKKLQFKIISFNF